MARKAKSAIDPKDKRGNFVRLAEKRTARAIQTIRLVASLANRGAYEFTEADVKKITAALTTEVEAMVRKFAAPGRKQDISFTLLDPPPP